ncbi:MAG: malate synthase [Parasphingorhabdus sp.]|jgi:malate synthase
MKNIQIGGLAIEQKLHEFVENELLPESGVDSPIFWSALEDIVRDLGSQNQGFLKHRDDLQDKIDQWHKQHPGASPEAYKSFLGECDYLESVRDDFAITSANIDAEVSSIAGPQLVVPLDNARYVLSAANARWGSLYDALYGTDALAENDGCRKTRRYNPIRGDRVVKFARDFLDRHFALDKGTHHWSTRYRVRNGRLEVRLGDGRQALLLRPERLTGYTGDADKPDSVVLCKNGLHLEICFGDGFFIGRRDHASIYDVRIESALTTIMDLEDSVASVDTEDKLKGYRNWLGLMRGTLKSSFEKDGESIDRTMNTDPVFTTPVGEQISLSGRSVLLVRSVGAHLNTNAVLLDGQPIPETMLDAMITAVSAKHDLLGNSPYKNSKHGSVYIVKPKMHGSAEVALAVELFSRVEQAIGLERNTLKMGIMDEERRTSVNLKNCIYAARERVFFINTGFLDRTGDEIHTSMEAGPVLPKAEMKGAKWLSAYENSNVDIGLQTGFTKKAQIGKGMWAAPDEMAAMLETKISHPESGANTAWVPSPTAATLHATHYMLLEVLARQENLQARQAASVDDILTIPLMDPQRKLSDAEINAELENNCQGILGYVARWVGQGIGCSKVPDINDVALMEDCATLRISSQHIANWLHHGILSESQIEAAMERMAIIVDRQNSNDPAYQPMSANFTDSIPYQASLDLALKGRTQPNGYTEFILYARRQQMKAG